MDRPAAVGGAAESADGVAELARKPPGVSVGWWALCAAIAGQIFWTWLALHQAQGRSSIAVLSLVVTLILGLVLVV